MGLTLDKTESAQETWSDRDRCADVIWVACIEALMDTAGLMKKAVNCEMIKMKSPHARLDDGR